MSSEKAKHVGSVMVVGGGIAGMQASLDLGEAGLKVYLVETSPTIGGVMLQLDKTFPTNDCATCIGSPKLIEVAKHPNIEILASSDVLGIEGEPGAFTVRVKRKARFVTDQCTGCGECITVCPILRPNEWDEGLCDRRAIFRSFVQAVPSTYLIEKRGTAPCKATCPAHVSVQGFVALTRQGKYREALELFKEDHPFPAICGRVCHHPCEGACTRGDVEAPVAIQYTHRFLADRDFESADPYIPALKEKRDEKIAVVGAGPAGLTAAYYLAIEGYPVTVFEKLPVKGGMMAVGIPEFRLPRDVLAREIKVIEDMGVEIRTGVTFGEDITFENLKQDGYQAFFLAMGLHLGQRLNIEGEDLPGVLNGVDFLREVSLGRKVEVGRRVAVVGGGNVAIDVARTCRRQGAEVTIVYRRERKDMPAWEHEIEDALAEGVVLKTLVAPKSIRRENARLVFELDECELGELDASGRRRPVPIEGCVVREEFDSIVGAIGQALDVSVAEGQGVPLTVRGGLEADPLTLATPVPGLFVGGDAYYGAKSVVDAVASGREAAESIHRYLNGLDLKEGREKDWSYEKPPIEDEPLRPRVQMRTVPPAQRKGFEETELGLTEDEVRAEVERCLACGICSECYQCVKTCKRGAIDHAMQDEILDLNIGAMVLAPGFKTTNPDLRPEFGYSRYPNVITSIEFERFLSAAGPYKGHIQRPSDGRDPAKVAWIQCVGSRDASIQKDYCSYACCMYAMKQTIIAMEHSSLIDPTIFYMDIRAQGKGFDRYYERTKSELGVRFVRSMVSRVTEDPVTHNLRIHYIDEEGAFQDAEFDLVVLSVGFTPHPESVELVKRLGVDVDRFGFCQSRPMDMVGTNRDGIFSCGVFQSPKDIPDSVVQASSAAAGAMALLADVRGTEVSEVEYPPERETLGEEPRIGVFVCHCGINIAGVVDVDSVAEYAMTLPNVAYADHLLFSCSSDSQVLIEEKIKEHNLNRVVVASCSPRTHEPLFQETLRKAGLNKYLFEMANIRDQCSWVHQKEQAVATEKAKDLVRMSVARAALLEPLYQFPFTVVQKGLVIGGGAAGMTAALNLADQGFEVTLVEKEAELGGNARKLAAGPRGENVAAHLDDMIAQVEAHPNMRVLRNAQVMETTGHVGEFTSRIKVQGQEEVHVEHGATIIAIGAQEYKPTEYLFGQNPKVVTQRDFQRLVLDRAIAGQDKDVVMIQCVGSRNEEHPYCSRICCVQAVSNAIAFKKARPEANVTILYRDVRTFGLYELMYKEARELGVQFVRYAPEAPPAVTDGGGKIGVAVLDQNLRETLEFRADYLVLSVAVVPDAESNREIASTLKLPLDQDGFFLEAHIKLRPIDFANAGYFLAGLAHAPKFLDESIAQAKGAASRAAGILSKAQMMVGGEVAVVDRENCVVCLTCVRTCPFGVPRVAADGFIMIEPAECRGCGNCASACPRKVIRVQHARDEQIVAKEMAICA